MSSFKALVEATNKGLSPENPVLMLSDNEEEEVVVVKKSAPSKPVAVAGLQSTTEASQKSPEVPKATLAPKKSPPTTEEPSTPLLPASEVQDAPVITPKSGDSMGQLPAEDVNHNDAETAAEEPVFDLSSFMPLEPKQRTDLKVYQTLVGVLYLANVAIKLAGGAMPIPTAAVAAVYLCTTKREIGFYGIMSMVMLRPKPWTFYGVTSLAASLLWIVEFFPLLIKGAFYWLKLGDRGELDFDTNLSEGSASLVQCWETVYNELHYHLPEYFAAADESEDEENDEPYEPEIHEENEISYDEYKECFFPEEQRLGRLRRNGYRMAALVYATWAGLLFTNVQKEKYNTVTVDLALGLIPAFCSYRASLSVMCSREDRHRIFESCSSICFYMGVCGLIGALCLPLSSHANGLWFIGNVLLIALPCEDFIEKDADDINVCLLKYKYDHHAPWLHMLNAGLLIALFIHKAIVLYSDFEELDNDNQILLIGLLVVIALRQFKINSSMHEARLIHSAVMVIGLVALALSSPEQGNTFMSRDAFSKWIFFFCVFSATEIAVMKYLFTW